MKFYYLKGKKPIATNSVFIWGREYEKNRFVDQTMVGNIRISTVFLGINHRFFNADTLPPILFETMIFGGVFNEYQERFETWEQAENGHKKAVEMVLNSVLLETESLKQSIIKTLN